MIRLCNPLNLRKGGAVPAWGISSVHRHPVQDKEVVRALGQSDIGLRTPDQRLDVKRDIGHLVLQDRRDIHGMSDGPAHTRVGKGACGSVVSAHLNSCANADAASDRAIIAQVLDLNIPVSSWQVNRDNDRRGRGARHIDVSAASSACEVAGDLRPSTNVSPHAFIIVRIGVRLRPLSVSVYSTRGGTSA